MSYLVHTYVTHNKPAITMERAVMYMPLQMVTYVATLNVWIHIHHVNTIVIKCGLYCSMMI